MGWWGERRKRRVSQHKPVCLFFFFFLNEISCCILEWGQTRGSSLHALIIIRFHFQPMGARVGVNLAQKQGSDSLPLVDFYRRCISRRDKCKQGGPGQEGCLKLDCRFAEGRRTVLTRHWAFFLRKEKKKLNIFFKLPSMHDFWL